MKTGTGWLGLWIMALTAGVPAMAQVPGGDTCETAPFIAALPFHTFGQLCEATHQYSAASCSGSESGPDVVYGFVPTREGYIRISICQSTIQPKLYVFKDNCNSSSVVACGQQTCMSSGQPRPEIQALHVEFGHIYFIVIDQASPLPCNPFFELSVTDLSCQFCPPGAAPENEPACGLSAGGEAADTVNGGCASELPHFTSIAPGGAVCGTIASISATDVRDTDWYEVVIAAPSRITWTILPEATLTVAVPENGGVHDCSRLQCLGQIVSTSFCASTVVATNRTAGSWWFFVAPPAGSNLPCTTRYSLRVDVDPITPDINGDGHVNTLDLGILLSGWTLAGGAPCAAGDLCSGDLNVDGVVNSADLGLLLSAWSLT